MPEVVKQEDPVEAFSLTGLWRSSLAQMEVYRDRPAPTCAFLLCLAYWSAMVWRMTNPAVRSPEAAGACLVREAVLSPHTSEWRRYALHAFWPIEPTYARGFLTSTAMVLQGYSLEYEIGTPHFAALLLGIHAATAAALLYFKTVTCFVSLEPAVVGLLIVMHRQNPKIHTDGLDKGIRVPFAVEPRWHVWIIQTVLLLLSVDFPVALASHVVGMAVGAFCALRDPDVLGEALYAARKGSPRVGDVIHVALFVFSIFFMPLTAAELPADLVSAFLDGRALSMSWWQLSVPSSPPMLHMGIAGTVTGEALFLCKLMVGFALPLLLSPFRMWLRAYSIACFILIMYAMNSPLWRFPHIGFLVLAYLVWAFWKLPNMVGPFKRD